MYKAILFDVDGVLIHAKRFGDYFQAQTGVKAEEMLPFYKGIFRDCQAGKADLKKEIIPWLKKWNYAKGPDEFLKEWFEYENQPDRELLQLVESLRKNGTKCYLATNQEKYRADFIWNEMNFKNYFDGMYCSALMGVSKPNLDFFEKISSDLKEKEGVEPPEIFFTDDEVGAVKSANSIGIDALVYTDCKSFKKFLFKNMTKRTMVIIGILATLLILSFIPFFTKSLMLGGEIKINFWQKYFMHID